jgi:hypothetical protein
MDFSNLFSGSASSPFSLGSGNTSYPGYSSLNTYGFTSPTSGAGVTSGLDSSTGLGMNIPTLQLGFQGLSSLANLYSGIQALGLAKDQFNFQKNLANTNLANSVQSYNTALTDKATARAVTEGQTDAQRDAYIAANKLST